MEKQGGFKLGLLPQLGLGILAGVLLGLFVPASVMGIIATIKKLLGSLIFFVVPLVIFGFIAPAICDLKANAGKMLGSFLLISYASAVGASLFSTVAGYILIPFLHIPSQAAALLEVPATPFALNIQPIMPVMTALLLAILAGISVIWTKAATVEKLLKEMQAMVLDDFCRTRVQRKFDAPASGILKSYRHRIDRAFYLDDAALSYRRRGFKEKSAGSRKALRPRICYGCRHDVERGNAAGRFALRA